MQSDFHVQPQIGGLGAEILDVDLSSDLSAQCIEKIRQCLWKYHVIVFREQQLTPQDQCVFASKLGTLKRHPFINSLEGFPEIMVVRKEPDEQHNFAGAWHTDTSYQATPAMGSMLHAVEVPENLGDTLFCNMVAACEALSPAFRSFLEPLRAIHSFTGRSLAGREQDLGYGALASNHQAAPKVLQPVIRMHPESARRALYVNPMFTESIAGLTSDESDTLLEYLFSHAIRPEFIYRLRWQVGTVVIWDNLSTMHCPLNDYGGHRRVMHRVVIAGTQTSGTPIEPPGV